MDHYINIHVQWIQTIYIYTSRVDPDQLAGGCFFGSSINKSSELNQVAENITKIFGYLVRIIYIKTSHVDPDHLH